MKGTDRDASIERLLRRAASPDVQPPASCPDSETLAALLDTRLTSAERRDTEAHVADCQRCQALTAAMVRAESASHAEGQPSGGAAWFPIGARKWLVPAAAAATAVALWVAIPDERTQPTETAESTAERQVAQVPSSAAPEPLRKDAAAPTEPRGNTETPPGSVEERLERTAPTAAPASPATADQSRAREAAVAGLQTAENERVGVRDERTTIQPQQPLAEPAAPAASPPAAPPAAARAATLSVEARAPAAFEVASPNPAIRWRVGPGPRVEYSSDRGATWTVRPTGASGELTAASAPAPDVCWLAGRQGLVLRTVDDGRQWQRIAFPEMADVTAITASSALDAIVNLADGRRFRTVDGGRTWVPIGN
jgi:hypothetical protein